MKTGIASVLALFCTSLVGGQQASNRTWSGKTLHELQAEIEALKPAKVAWRQIAWKSCLLEGLKASRAQKKPILLWVFIDRPIDDERC